MVIKIDHPYAVQKSALDKANEQLFYLGVDTTIVRFGRFDTARVAHIDAPKMPVSYCVSVIGWVLSQPHRVKDDDGVPMKTQSAKAKGRRLQQWVRNLLIEELEIHPEDIESRSMGARGW